MSVSVASVSPNGFTLTTDSGHVLHPATMTLSANAAGNLGMVET